MQSGERHHGLVITVTLTNSLVYIITILLVYAVLVKIHSTFILGIPTPSMENNPVVWYIWLHLDDFFTVWCGTNMPCMDLFGFCWPFLMSQQRPNHRPHPVSMAAATTGCSYQVSHCRKGAEICCHPMLCVWHGNAWKQKFGRLHAYFPAAKHRE